MLFPHNIPKSKCTICNEKKDLFLFPFHKKNKSGFDFRCFECKTQEEKTLDEIKKVSPPCPDILECACCHQIVDEMRFDHCHVNKTYRGWICEQCNLGIGLLKDNFDGVLNAAIYLAKVEDKNEIYEILKKIKNGA